MTDADCSKPIYESSVKLCAAVKKYKCLHDQTSYTKNAPPLCESAWELVADEVNESIEFCKNRWKSLRRCFFDGLRRKGNKYYLHDHLDYLLKVGQKNSKRNSEALQIDETNSTNSETLKKKPENKNLLLKRKQLKACDDDDVRSFDSHTTSADESNDISPQTAGVFIINEFGDDDDDDDNYEPDIDLDKDRRLSFSRSCKRALDSNLIGELADEEPEQKRLRKTDKSITKSSAAKIKVATPKSETEKGKLLVSSIGTQNKIRKEVATQYELVSADFDDLFMQSINSQLKAMNGRQKLNFKRKIYQSLLEVFDDGNDFPNANETLASASRQPPHIVNTTVGELRLMRELVSLVQAAKTTPEIMNAKEKSITSTPPISSKPITQIAASATPPKAENRSKTKSPLSISPTTDDDELPFFIDDSEEEEFPLPRSWDEIKSKTAETAKATTAQETNLSLPRRILQKVVRVSGANGGTIVARDGDKKRIYRIIPKQNNQNITNAAANKNETSANRIMVSTVRSNQDSRKDGSVGTFYVSNNKNPQEIAKSSNNTANITIRSVNNKPSNGQQQLSATATSAAPSSNINKATASTANFNNTNGQTIFKNVHPANRILSSSTGFFKMVPSVKNVVPSPNQKPSTQSTTAATSPAAGSPTNSKLITTKLSMLPPLANALSRKLPAMRPAPQLLQRRFSICDSLLSEKLNAKSAANASTNTISPIQSPVSRIQISHPVSLNAKAGSSPTQTQAITKIPEAPVFQHTAKHTETSSSVKPKDDESKQSLATVKKSMVETTKAQREIPVLQTAGTIAADDLDPLFVKAPHVKSEPIDVDD